MANKKTPIQFSFAGGEISPLLDMKFDWEGRNATAHTMLNWFSLLQGPAETRGGFEFIDSVTGTRGSLIPFAVDKYSSFLMIITPAAVFLADECGLVQTDNVINNPDFLNQGTSWISAAVGSAAVRFADGRAVLESGSQASHYSYIGQNATVVAGTDYDLTIAAPGKGASVIVQVGSTAGGDDIIAGQEYSDSGVIRIKGISSPTTTMGLIIKVVGSQGQRSIAKVVLAPSNSSLYRSFASPWTSYSDIIGIQYGQVPGEDRLFLTSPNVAVQYLDFNKTTLAWDFGSVTFTAPPAAWAAGNYPQAIAFFEGRTYFGGSHSNPETFWASVSGSFTDFTMGSNPADAITHTISQKGRIQWMEASDDLLVGTDRGEYKLVSEGGVIIPGDIDTVVQSKHGGAPVPPSSAGINLLYASGDRQKVLSMSYEWTKNRWQSKDVSFQAEHMFSEAVKIDQMVYAASPHQIVWIKTSDGNLVGITYDSVSQFAGFHRHSTEGTIRGIAVRRYAGSDELWILVSRDIDDSSLMIEKYVVEASVDSFYYTEYPAPTNVVTGLDHLEGVECRVVVDEAVHPNVTPVDGEISLDQEGTRIYVGRAIANRLVTPLRDDGGTGGNTYSASALASMKRSNKVWVRIIESHPPLINGRRSPGRRPSTPMDTAEPARTEFIQVSLRGWTRENYITIEQDLPIKTRVAGWVGEVSHNQ